MAYPSKKSLELAELKTIESFDYEPEELLKKERIEARSAELLRHLPLKEVKKMYKHYNKEVMKSYLSSKIEAVGVCYGSKEIPYYSPDCYDELEMFQIPEYKWEDLKENEKELWNQMNF